MRVGPGAGLDTFSPASSRRGGWVGVCVYVCIGWVCFGDLLSMLCAAERGAPRVRTDHLHQESRGVLLRCSSPFHSGETGTATGEWSRRHGLRDRSLVCSLYKIGSASTGPQPARADGDPVGNGGIWGLAHEHAMFVNQTTHPPSQCEPSYSLPSPLPCQ